MSLLSPLVVFALLFAYAFAGGIMFVGQNAEQNFTERKRMIICPFWLLFCLFPIYLHGDLHLVNKKAKRKGQTRLSCYVVLDSWCWHFFQSVLSSEVEVLCFIVIFALRWIDKIIVWSFQTIHLAVYNHFVWLSWIRNNTIKILKTK